MPALRFLVTAFIILTLPPLMARADEGEYRYGRYDTAKSYSVNVKLLRQVKETLNRKFQRLSMGKDSETGQDIVIGANEGVVYHIGFMAMTKDFIAHDDERAILKLEKEFGLDGRTRVVKDTCGYDFACTDIFYGCRGKPSKSTCVFQIQSMTNGRGARTAIFWRRLAPLS